MSVLGSLSFILFYLFLFFSLHFFPFDLFLFPPILPRFCLDCELKLKKKKACLKKGFHVFDLDFLSSVLVQDNSTTQDYRETIRDNRPNANTNTTTNNKEKGRRGSDGQVGSGGGRGSGTSGGNRGPSGGRKSRPLSDSFTKGEGGEGGGEGAKREWCNKCGEKIEEVLAYHVCVRCERVFCLNCHDQEPHKDPCLNGKKHIFPNAREDLYVVCGGCKRKKGRGGVSLCGECGKIFCRVCARNEKNTCEGGEEGGSRGGPHSFVGDYQHDEGSLSFFEIPALSPNVPSSPSSPLPSPSLSPSSSMKLASALEYSFE